MLGGLHVGVMACPGISPDSDVRTDHFDDTGSAAQKKKFRT
jgi:hypothetical protein